MISLSKLVPETCVETLAVPSSMTRAGLGLAAAVTRLLSWKQLSTRVRCLAIQQDGPSGHPTVVTTTGMMMRV